MSSQVWEAEEKILVNRTAYSIRKGQRRSQYAAVLYLQTKLPRRSFDGIRNKLRRALGLLD